MPKLTFDLGERNLDGAAREVATLMIPTGFVDSASCRFFERALETADRKGRRFLVLDLSRVNYIKSKWDYQEFFPKGGDTRIKMMKIMIPLNDGTIADICYTIPRRPKKVSKVQMGYATKLKDMDCRDFDKLKPK